MQFALLLSKENEEIQMHKTIQVCDGVFVVPDAIGIVESIRDHEIKPGHFVCTTIIRSTTGGTLFERTNTAQSLDSEKCKAILQVHKGYMKALGLPESSTGSA